jgi:hypothetical protein
MTAASFSPPRAEVAIVTIELSEAEIDAVIAAWGVAQSATMRREDRGSLSSELFDIRGRTWVGYEAYFHVTPELLEELSESISPEEVGRRMKQPGCRPYYLQLFVLMSNYLSAREQRILVDGEPPEASSGREQHELEVLVDFFTRATRAYREDGDVVPTAPEFDQRILGADWVAMCEDLLGPTEEMAAVQAAVAAVSLYSFLLHGEQRDGHFDHGPYRLEDGTSLLLHELNDVANDFVPWAERDRPLGVSNICIAYALRDVAMQFSIFGGCLTDPVDFRSRVERIAVFTVEDGVARPLPLDELQALAIRAGELQMDLYGRILDWPDIERVRYGRWLYGNHLVPFLRLADRPALVERAAERFREVGQVAAEEFIAGPPIPAVFQTHSELDESSMYTRLATARR